MDLDRSMAERRSRRGRVRTLDVPMLLGAVVLVSACATPVPILHQTVGAPVGCYLDTEQQVRFEVHPVYGTAIDGEPLRWPDGYVGRPTRSGVEVLDENGDIAARSGDTITVCESGNDDGYMAIR